MKIGKKPKLMAEACGTTISWSGSSGPEDENGHPVQFIHTEWADRIAVGRRAVLQLHALDLVEVGPVPLCLECRKVYPCPTALAIL